MAKNSIKQVNILYFPENRPYPGGMVKDLTFFCEPFSEHLIVKDLGRVQKRALLVGFYN